MSDTYIVKDAAGKRQAEDFRHSEICHAYDLLFSPISTRFCDFCKVELSTGYPHDVEKLGAETRLKWRL
jgi:hypothetical protein